MLHDVSKMSEAQRNKEYLARMETNMVFVMADVMEQLWTECENINQECGYTMRNEEKRHYNAMKHNLQRFRGVTRMLAPTGSDERYIWASLSPDGSRVLYYVSGKGAFVCDIDGSHVTAMGNLTAPKWWDNKTIVGMDEEDGEYTITASRIVARTLSGEQQVLTGDDVIATYPLPCAQSGKIVFSTPDGQIYLITAE